MYMCICLFREMNTGLLNTGCLLNKVGHYELIQLDFLARTPNPDSKQKEKEVYT